MTKNASLPAGWSVELLGMIGMVKFSSRDGRVLEWVDGTWYVARGHVHRTAAGVPAAHSMLEARRIGTAWLTSIDEE